MVYILVLLLTMLISLFLIKTQFGIYISIGPQKFHKGFIPRVGGLAIFTSFILVNLFF